MLSLLTTKNEWSTGVEIEWEKVNNTALNETRVGTTIGNRRLGSKWFPISIEQSE